MDRQQQKTDERGFGALGGWPMFGVWLALVAGAVATIREAALARTDAVAAGWGIFGGFLILTAVVHLCGFFVVNPNASRVLVLFGRYRGTVRRNGFFWTNPFTIKTRVSLRARNFDSDKLKVNDKGGSPIEIAAVVVWVVRDTAHALFDVDDYEEYVRIQAESAIRGLASRYHYDAEDEDDVVSLRTARDEVSHELKQELDARLERAGVDVVEARLSHLAYAPEIAGAMLRRQQADAVIAARKKIVDGAVGMVEMALGELQSKNVLDLDDERRATMVSNLLVVLCSEQATQPVVNTGSLYN